jgi:hypothetical protein
VIRTVSVDGGVGLAAELPRGSVAYVDRDWVPAEEGIPVPAVVRSGAGSEVAAARAFLRLARDAAAAVGDARPVEVHGSGAVATLTAGIMGVDTTDRVGRPAAVVEATGAPDAISDAAARLADLGTLVLVGEALGRAIRLNLYPDVHSRGLRLVGVRPPGADKSEGEHGGTREEELLARLPPAAEVRRGTVPDARAAWYRVA